MNILPELEKVAYERGLAEGYKRGYLDGSDAVEQWISVEDNLPEEGDCVLCWLEYINDIFGHAYDTLCFHDGVFGIFDTDSYKVTHWQPLPSPPNQKLNH